MLRTACLLALLASSAAAQANDVGLTMDGGVLTVIYGQVCGPVACTPFNGGVVSPGQTRSLVIYAKPSSLYAVAIGLPGPCLPIPGIGNSLLIDVNSLFVLDVGLTSAPPFVPLPCQQGVASASFTLPTTTPIGLYFRVQAFGESLGGGFALGPTIEALVL